MRLAINGLLLLVSVTRLGAQQRWLPDEFPIFYWHGPTPAFNTLEHWQRVKECNFTVAGPTYYGTEDNRKVLAFCRQLGIKALLSDPRLNPQMLEQEDWREIVGRVVADYASDSATLGYYLHDEPNYSQFAALGQVNTEIQRRDPKHPVFVNLFPTYASSDQLGSPTYADHLEKYLTIVKPAILAYDHYALMKGGGLRADYFENLELIREHALRFDVPAWNTILSVPHLGYRDPTAGEIRWQAYTSLAYGMKGIGWFTYWTINGWEKEGTAILTTEGKPARLFPIVRQINGEVRVLGKILLRLNSTGVFHTHGAPPGCRRLGSDALVQIAGDPPLVLGFFRDPAGGDFAMVVNRDYARPLECSLSFRPHVTSVAEMSATDGSAKALSLSNQHARLKLAPGDGRLLRLTTNFAYPQAPKPVTMINFQFNSDGDAESWGHLNSLSAVSVKDGSLTMTITGSDPYFSRGNLRIARDSVTKIKLRMKLPPCDATAQFFWATSDEPDFRDDKYLDFPVKPDGTWHEYEIPVGTHAKWRGKIITAIRLDPTQGGAAPGTKVQIDHLRGE
jgi:hypothetical protein